MLNLPKDKELAKQVLTSNSELQIKKMDQGWLGVIWGSKNSIPNNVAAFFILVLLITNISYTLLVANIPPTEIGISIKDLWAITTPLITLAFGYLCGKKYKF